MKILLLEDEERAALKLMDCIHNQKPLTSIEWKRSIEDAISFLSSQPLLDLIFADIELLDGNVFYVFQSIQPTCPIIFCTAYDHYYVEAFQTNGIAYLLKPYSKTEFSQVWHKYCRLFQRPLPNLEVWHQFQALSKKEEALFKRKFIIRKREGAYLIDVADIAFFRAKGDFVLAIDQNEEKNILNQSLQQINSALNPNYFFQINRSEIVNIEYIHKYHAYLKNRVAITLKNSKTILYTSNSRTPKFRKWLEQ